MIIAIGLVTDDAAQILQVIEISIPAKRAPELMQRIQRELNNWIGMWCTQEIAPLEEDE